MHLVTSKLLANKLFAYLGHEMGLEDLVDWAEEVMMDGGFEESNYEMLRRIVARLGVADVRAFGLTWEDCKNFLNQLGYHVRIEVEDRRTGELSTIHA